LSSWRAANEKELIGSKSENRRPSSVDLGQLPKTRSLLGKYFGARKQLKRKPKEIVDSITPLPSKPTPEFQESHFHLYEANSVFLNELFLYWNRQMLVNGLNINYVEKNILIYKNISFPRNALRKWSSCQNPQMMALFLKMDSTKT
jgi:hypothetical protein